MATESSEVATTLEAVVAGLELKVSRTVAPIYHEATPASPWPPKTRQERFTLLFTRKKP